MSLTVMARMKTESSGMFILRSRTLRKHGLKTTKQLCGRGMISGGNFWALHPSTDHREKAEAALQVRSQQNECGNARRGYVPLVCFAGPAQA